MEILEFFKILIHFSIISFLAYFLAGYLHRIFFSPFAFQAKAEDFILQGLGVDSKVTQSPKEYFLSLLSFHVLGFLLLFSLLVFQNHLAFNPQSLPGLPLDLAFNITVSFLTNTNWQSYSGESTLSYTSQFLGLGVQNFFSPAAGIAVFLVLVRSFQFQKNREFGNFYVDVFRAILWVLLPLSLLVAVLLMNEGVIQNFREYIPLADGRLFPGGPAASQIAIKQVGTNGGGFFGVNSLHPLENPSSFSNLVEIYALLLLPISFPFLFGKGIGKEKEGIILYSLMTILLLIGIGISLHFEMSQVVAGHSPVLEGKDSRFSIADSVFWAVSTTATSNGSVNAMHDSFSAISVLVLLFNMLTGEVIFGGVGCGMYGMVLYAILTVFISGLMIGRTPEYLGRKIGAKEIQLSSLGLLFPSVAILTFLSFAVMSSDALSSRTNLGPRGLSEMLYAFASALGNNGSALGGLNANTMFYNMLLGVGMLLGRFVVMFSVFFLASSFLGKKIVEESLGTFHTDTVLFLFLLLFVIFLVGALTFFPVLLLGPFLEHFLLP